MSHQYTLVKRLLDIVLGGAGLVLSLPVILAAMVMIRVDTPGPALFRQKRVGKDGKPFTIYKLRGMYIDAKERFPELYDYSEHEGLEFYFHQEEDPRVTRVGRFIRKTSIDELPNFFNVLKGDMSMVGPRPEIPEVLDLYGEHRERYLSVKPGITCYSKAYRRDTANKQETLEMDLRYIEEACLWLDLKIIFRTAQSVLARRNVF